MPSSATAMPCEVFGLGVIMVNLWERMLYSQMFCDALSEYVEMMRVESVAAEKSLMKMSFPSSSVIGMGTMSTESDFANVRMVYSPPSQVVIAWFPTVTNGEAGTITFWGDAFDYLDVAVVLVDGEEQALGAAEEG